MLWLERSLRKRNDFSSAWLQELKANKKLCLEGFPQLPLLISLLASLQVELRCTFLSNPKPSPARQLPAHASAQSGSMSDPEAHVLLACQDLWQMLLLVERLCYAVLVEAEEMPKTQKVRTRHSVKPFCVPPVRNCGSFCKLLLCIQSFMLLCFLCFCCFCCCCSCCRHCYLPAKTRWIRASI